MLKKVKECADEIPQETRLIIAALDSPIRQAILVLLNKNEELSFSELQQQFSVGKLTLNFHLKKLFSNALIDHYYKHEVGNQKFSFYSITPLGSRILASLNNALTPPPPTTAKGT